MIERVPEAGLATGQQVLTERRAIAAFETAEVQLAIARVTAHFLEDRNAAYPRQKRLIEQSASEHMFHACLMACSETPRQPRFVWAVCHDHKWFGINVPGSRFGQDNSDNAYRLAYIDSELAYRVRGRFREEPPVDFSISVMAAQLGENIFADTLYHIGKDELDVGADGSFELALDASPTAGRRNHLCIEGGKLLLVRDTMADWCMERPCDLTIELVGHEQGDSYEPRKAASRAAQLGETSASFLLERLQHGYFESGPLNTLNPPWAAGSAGGLVTQASSLGHYGLNEDQAMIITADPMKARYVGMQITDIWMLSYEYRNRTSSLNHSQALKSSDGLYRWVISVRDPGVHNWLDSGGNARGTILLRWHHIPGNVVPHPDKVQVEVVKLNQLRDRLPADTVWLDSAGREAQRARRVKDYEKRMR